MKNWKVKLENILNMKSWFERIEARNEREVKDVVYARYGVIVEVLAVTL